MQTRILEFINQDLNSIVYTGVKKSSSSEYSKVVIKPFLSNDTVKFQIEFTVGTKVIHENIEKEFLAVRMEKLFLETFNQCKIFGGEFDYHVNCFNGKIKAKKSEPTKQIMINEHNKKKQYILNEGEDIDFLIHLGIMTKEKKVLKSKYNKFRQINKYLELLSTSINILPSDRPLKIVDFGCGKAYLTFALYYYVVKVLKREAFITGLDLKEDVIDFCNKVAKELNYEDLEFQKGDIKNYSRTQDVDMVIMLHACDTATDEGITQSLKFGAKVIIAVPCCQHEIALQIKNRDFNTMLQFGIIKEKLSSLVTDSLRAQILKAVGYDVTVMEFIETEHTPKNIAIKATKTGEFNPKEFKEYEKLTDLFNLKPYIEKRFYEEGILKIKE